MNTGERIKQLRKDLGLTQEMFASELGISPQYLSAIERGKKNPSVQLIKSISARFGINEEYFKNYDGPVQKDSFELSAETIERHEDAVREIKAAGLINKLKLCSRIIDQLTNSITRVDWSAAIDEARMDEVKGIRRELFESIAKFQAALLINETPLIYKEAAKAARRKNKNRVKC
jgi:transcriptional regulator with XRE-family HTH domain